ncbi:hypothetical protein ACFE04_015219 [Oxalis oulophora]
MQSNLFKITSKITHLAKSGHILYARKLFDEMPQRDTIAWNAMLTSYSQLGLHKEALSLSHNMIIANTRPDNFTFTATLNACANIGDYQNGLKQHALVMVSGYENSLPVCNSLVDMYGKCMDTCSASKVFRGMDDRNKVTWCSLLFAYVNAAQFDVAREIFDSMPARVNVSWNIMIAGHAKYGKIESCLNLFKEMQESSCMPDHWTLSSLMNACGETLDFPYGCMIHAIIVKTGWNSAVEAKNSVLSFYAKLGFLSDAIQEYKSIDMLTQVSWNAIIDAHMRTGNTHEALSVFQQAPEKNVVSWTSMITGYVRNGDGDKAINFFINLMRNALHPDDYTFGSVLHACSNLASLGLGRMIHGSIICSGYCSYVYVGNGLVNMYAKCGDVKDAHKAFNDILYKDLISWNAMLFGLGMHGLASSALKLYDEMLDSGTKPDKVTFVGLLMTCSHSGLISKGQELFESMKLIHGVNYENDHVICMVDMLSRGGYLLEAQDLATKYLKSGNGETSLCEAVLGSCSAREDVKLGTYFGESLKAMEPNKDMGYVLLSNLYCASGQWKEAETVRKAMVNQGVKKTPGCSWIEVRNEVLCFVAGNDPCPYVEELRDTLNYLEFEMRNPTCFVKA